MQYVVDSNATLQQALNIARPGAEILLKTTAEAYNIEIRSALSQTATDLHIRSYDPLSPATVETIYLENANDVHIDNIKINSLLTEREDWKKDINIRGGSEISITNSAMMSDASGPLLPNGGATVGESLGNVQDVNGFTFSNNTVSNYNFGLAVLESRNIRIADNDIANLQGDAIRLGGVADIIIENNHIHDLFGSDTSINHMDMIQLWSTNAKIVSENVIIRGNILDAGDGVGTQSIFMRNEQADSSPGGASDRFYKNITIVDNVIYNGHKHGITVGEAYGVKIANNTLITNIQAGMITEGGGGSALSNPAIQVVESAVGVSITDNVSAGVTAPGSAVVKGNLAVNYLDPSMPNYYGNLFLNVEAGGGVSLTGLKARPGGLLDGSGIGAPLTQFDTTPAELTAGFVTEPVNGSETVFRFDGRRTADEGGYLLADEATFIWKFDDGILQTGQVIEHVFHDFGDHDVQLLVTTEDGRSSEMHAEVAVSDPVLLDIQISKGQVDDTSSYQSAIDFKAENASDEGIRIAKGETLSVESTSSQIYALDQFSLAFDMKLDGGVVNPAGVLAFVHHSFTLKLTPRGELSFQMDTGQGEQFDLVSNGADLLDTDWHRIALSFDGIGGEFALFVDGTEVGSIAVSGSTKARDWAGLVFGSDWNASFTGRINSIEMTADPLSPEDVRQDYRDFLQERAALPGSGTPDPAFSDNVPDPDDGTLSGGSPDGFDPTAPSNSDVVDRSGLTFGSQDTGTANLGPDGGSIADGGMEKVIEALTENPPDIALKLAMAGTDNSTLPSVDPSGADWFVPVELAPEDWVEISIPTGEEVFTPVADFDPTSPVSDLYLIT